MEFRDTLEEICKSYIAWGEHYHLCPKTAFYGKMKEKRGEIDGILYSLKVLCKEEYFISEYLRGDDTASRIEIYSFKDGKKEMLVSIGVDYD